MMGLLRFAFVLPALGAAAAEVSEVRMSRSLSVEATGRVQKAEDMIRKVSRKSSDAASDVSSQRVSTFAGLKRTDRYAMHRGLNCSSLHGGSDIDTNALSGQTLAQCQTSCRQDDQCTCVNFEAGSGTCRKQKICYPESCAASLLSDVYMQHSTFETTDHRTQFARSGGRECTIGSTYSWKGQNKTITLEDSSLEKPKSVKQCLELCTDSCSCVRFSRYYVGECVLMQHCQNPVFCERSERYDMYVRADHGTGDQMQPNNLSY